MAEQDKIGDRYHDTHDAAHPHEMVLTPAVARVALWAWLGPLVSFSAIMGLLLIYWSMLGPAAKQRPDNTVIGTSGQISGDERYGEYSTEGGGEPLPRQKRNTPVQDR